MMVILVATLGTGIACQAKKDKVPAEQTKQEKTTEAQEEGLREE